MLKTLIRCSKQYSVTKCRFYSTSWEEVRIPVPWGHVAGKWWGPKDKRPIITCHGWLDNSGSFDTLIPLLPKTSSFLAIDLPGCGYSSKLPPGLFYHFIDNVILIRRLVKYFNWGKVSFLGHSMGAALSYTYTMIYPEEVDYLICLEALTPLTQGSELIDQMRKGIINFLKYDSINSMNEEPPSYTYEELKQKLHEGLKSVDLNSCKYILNRNIKASSKDANKYYFTMDQRLKVLELLRWSEDELVENADRLQCPILLIKVDKSVFFGKKNYAKKVIQVIKKNNKNFEMHDVEGLHHIHLNNPERIENLINQFLAKYDIGDRSYSGFRKENVYSLS